MDPLKPLQKVNLLTLSQNHTKQYTNFIVNTVNASCLRLAVFTGDYPWHFHPTSDELFMVVEGELFIELQDQATVALKPNEIFTIPAGVIHRTRAPQRTVNLTIEHSDSTTEFLENQ
jgi:mannose-6-phosphate isomerase-like protein (cupin superfamily)